MKISALLPSPGYRRQLQIRRLAAGVLVLAAGATALSGMVRTDPTVLVFTRDLAVGETVTDDALRLAHVPADVIPESAVTDPDEVAGRIVVTAAGAGEIVTGHRITGTHVLAGLAGSADGAEELTVVPVRLADPDTVALLHHGDRVTIVTADDESGRPVIVARGGRVVVADPENPSTVLIALPEEEAHDVAAISLSAPLGIVLTPGH